MNFGIFIKLLFIMIPKELKRLFQHATSYKEYEFEFTEAGSSQRGENAIADRIKVQFRFCEVVVECNE